MMPPRLAVREIAFFERPVRFVRPFRFGAVVVNATPQAFVRVEIEVEGKGTSVGASAELLVPKWFDKRPQLSPEQTVGELRRSLADRARALSGASELRDRLRPARAPHRGAGRGLREEDIPPLAAGYGPAEIDKAILDALLRAAGVNFFDGMAANIAGIDARLVARSCAMRTSRNSSADAGGWSGSRSGIPSASTTRSRARAASPMRRENAGARYFKLKLNGDPEHDAARLTRIGRRTGYAAA